MNECCIASVKKIESTPKMGIHRATFSCHSRDLIKVPVAELVVIFFKKFKKILQKALHSPGCSLLQSQSHHSASAELLLVAPPKVTPKLKGTRCYSCRHDSSPYQTCHLLDGIFTSNNCCRCRCMTPHSAWQIYPV